MYFYISPQEQLNAIPYSILKYARRASSRITYFNIHFTRVHLKSILYIIQTNSAQHGLYYIFIIYIYSIYTIKPRPLITTTYHTSFFPRTNVLMANTLTSHRTRRGVSRRQRHHM